MGTQVGQPVALLAQEQQVNVVREIQLKGLFELLVGDEMTIVDVDGKRHRLRIQDNPEQPIGLSGGDIALNSPAAIEVRASVSPSVLRAGMVISLSCQLGGNAKCDNITAARLLPIGSVAQGVDVESLPVGQEMVAAEVQGIIKSVNAKKLVLTLPRHELVPRQTITLDTGALPELEYTTSSLGMLKSGDVIELARAADLSTGDSVVRSIQIELIGIRDNLALSMDEQLQWKYATLSDDPTRPRELRSEHFLMKTDISDRQAQVLLDKLEGMFALVAEYYGRRPRTPVEVYVVDQLSQWDVSEWDPRVVNKVRNGEGTTLYRRVGSEQQAVVFAANKQDVVQHEAVHGFCFLTFQNTGPLWYAEGMAEMGQYWRADDLAVSANPAVIGYLRSRPPQPLKSIINATKIEGETWKAYAWRWALCHFLANNPNYAEDFRRLGISLMKQDSRASFENTWRRQANELTFEYEQFLLHLEAGLRADLCAWDWNRQASVTGSRAIQQTVLANRGWQPTGALLESGVTYETRAQGTWKLSADSEAVDADGGEQGEGRLVGVIMKDYQLSEEFELGVDPEFSAVADGALYVRCRERMSLIADNQGDMAFAIRRKKE